MIICAADVKAVPLNEDGWPDTPCCRDKTYVPDLCRLCSAAFYADNERRLRETPDENREYQAAYAHACGYRD
jgi:hypothetical protein